MTAPRQVGRADVLAAVTRLADVAEPPSRDTSPPPTRWIGIDGFGCSGKSALAAQIVAVTPRATVVHVDDFCGPQVREWDWGRFENQVAAPLRAGRAARYQVWGWDRDAAGPWVDVAPGRLVVVEGVSSTRREVAVEWDLTVWVDAPRELRLARARERDGPAMMPRWLDDWMPLEEAYAAREQPCARADLVCRGW